MTDEPLMTLSNERFSPDTQRCGASFNYSPPTPCVIKVSRDLSQDVSVNPPVLNDPRVCNVTKKSSLKTKELFKQAEDKVLKRYKSGLGYFKNSSNFKHLLECH